MMQEKLFIIIIHQYAENLISIRNRDYRDENSNLFVNSCDVSKWRLGTTAVVPGLPTLALDAVIPARHSLECPYVTRGLGVVDRTLGACPVFTRSSRHLTSHLFHSYTRISTTHSLRPQACVISFLCDFSVSQGQRGSHLSRYTSRLRPRLHILDIKFAIKSFAVVFVFSNSEFERSPHFTMYTYAQKCTLVKRADRSNSDIEKQINVT